MRHEKKTFMREPVELDGNEYVGCTFESCTIIYRGRAGYTFGDNRISTDSQFEFADAAANTLTTMRMIWSLGEWGRASIIKTFQSIAPDLKKLN
jgi:hypothetical protein